MSSQFRTPLALFLIVCSSLAAAAAQLSQPREVDIKLQDQQIRSAGIETQPLAQERGVTELVVPGSVVVPPQQLRMVATPAAGLIESFMVAPDEDVREGEPIAQLRSPDLVEAQRAFLEAAAQEALAQEKLRRDEQLYKERIIAERRVLVTRAEAVLARSTLDERSQLLALHGMSETEIAALRKSRRIASSLVIRAPVAGTILKRHGVPGERVASTAPLVTIARLDPIWVNLQVPVARAVLLTNKGRVSLPAYGAIGRIVRVGRTVDAATQSVTAVAEFSVNEATIRPGQVVQSTIMIETSKAPQWRVPAASVVRHEGRDWIFLRTADGFRAVTVDVVAESSTTASVRVDVKPGETVASRGVLILLAELTSAGK